jgi:hypothetical protein
MVTSPKRLGPEKTTLARTSSIYKRQTRPLVREGAPENQDRNCQRLINKSPDFDDISSCFPCILCDGLKYVNPGDELLVTEM